MILMVLKFVMFMPVPAPLGLEALSRGASEVHFIEKDFIVAKMLEENISSLVR